MGSCIVCFVFAGALILKISLDAQRIATAGGAGGDPTKGFIYFRF